jgi:hypothetical protein
MPEKSIEFSTGLTAIATEFRAFRPAKFDGLLLGCLLWTPRAGGTAGIADPCSLSFTIKRLANTNQTGKIGTHSLRTSVEISDRGAFALTVFAL